MVGTLVSKEAGRTPASMLNFFVPALGANSWANRQRGTVNVPELVADFFQKVIMALKTRQLSHSSIDNQPWSSGTDPS